MPPPSPFASMLRRAASSSVLPRALPRAARTFRTTTVVARENLCISRGSFSTLPLPSLTDFYGDPISRQQRAIVYQRTEDYLAAMMDRDEELDNFQLPFSTLEITGDEESIVLLTRTDGYETVQVEFDMLDVDEEDEPDYYSYSIPMVATFSKMNGDKLVFEITAFPNEITIDSLSIQSASSAGDHLPYQDPDFGVLNSHEEWCQYLKLKGIKPNTFYFLMKEGQLPKP